MAKGYSGDSSGSMSGGQTKARKRAGKATYQAWHPGSATPF